MAKQKIFICLSLFLLVFTLSESEVVTANPQGAEVAAGNVSITSAGNLTQVNQSSSQAIINWNSFNIAANEKTQFNQPSSQAIALNRISENQGASSILGQLTANGQVWLVNPSGIFFGASAQVDVAGLLATSANIADSDFLSGNYHFTHGQGSVINAGTIRVSDGGFAALVAPDVENSGVIQANLGKVALAAGSDFTLDFYGDNLINFDASSVGHSVSNSGKIIANGGRVLLTAQTAQNVVNHAVNMSGYIQANSVHQHKGEIVLSGGTKGTVYISGKMKVSRGNVSVSGASTYIGPDALIDVSAFKNGNGGNVVIKSTVDTQFYGTIFSRGGSQSGNGGNIEVSGSHLTYQGLVNASAPHGSVGSLLLDPEFIVVQTGGGASLATVSSFANDPTGTDTIDPSAINSAVANVTLQANTDVTFSSNVAMTGAGISLTVDAGRSIILDNGVSVATNNAAITMLANNNAATAADRLVGAGNITMGTGSSLSSGTAAMNLTVGSTATGGFTPGSITLAGITAQNLVVNSPTALTLNGAVSSTGTVALNTNTSAASGNDFTLASGASISTTNATASAVVIDVNAAGGGNGNANLVGNISSGSGGTVTIATNTGANSTGGSITRTAGTLSAGTGNIILAVPAIGGSTSGIGASGASIFTTATGTFTLTAGTGGAYLSNTGNMTLAAPTLSASGSPLSITSTTGSLTTSGNVTTNGGNITFSSFTGMTIANTLSTGLGTIALNANTGGAGANNFTMSASGVLTTTNTGSKPA